MIILKWYSIVLFSFATLLAFFKSGRKNENMLGTFIGFLIELPILIYLILK